MPSLLRTSTFLVIACSLGSRLAFAQPTPPAEEWLPKLSGAKTATAFPSIVPPKYAIDAATRQSDQKAYDRDLGKLCPRLLGDMKPEPTGALKIVPGDDILRKLLKARLHQGRLELLQARELIQVGKWDTTMLFASFECLADMQDAATELCGSDTKELASWLEEFLILAKEGERFTEARYTAGVDPPQNLDAAIRHRLKVESALWKARNRK